MRAMLNIVINGFILWMASRLFPETVQIDGIGTLVLATFLLAIVTVAIVLLCMFVAVIGVACDNTAWFIVGFVASLFSCIIAMTILSNKLDGFMIVGLWPKVLLSICFSLFKLNDVVKDD